MSRRRASAPPPGSPPRIKASALLHLFLLPAEFPTLGPLAGHLCTALGWRRPPWLAAISPPRPLAVL
eukprot:2019871-Alexandrium_andersonii.AAC.1